MHQKEKQAALLVVLVVLIIFVLGMGAIWYFSSRTSTLPLPTSLPTDTQMTVTPTPLHTYLAASFNGSPISLELATTTAAQERGLGGRTSVPDNYGLLFVFATEGNYGFWMKDMKAPIDIYWLSDNGAVVTMKTNVATGTYPTVFYPTGSARYVLETRAGYGTVHSIRIGSILNGIPR